VQIASFASAAAYCDENIQALDLYGNEIELPRFQCNLVLQRRRSTGDVIRGVRTTARLLLSYGAGQLLVEVADNGAGFIQEGKAGHWGLVGMRERAARIGATLAIDSTPGAGTRVTLRVPARLAYAAV